MTAKNSESCQIKCTKVYNSHMPNAPNQMQCNLIQCESRFGLMWCANDIISFAYKFCFRSTKYTKPLCVRVSVCACVYRCFINNSIHHTRYCIHSPFISHRENVSNCKLNFDIATNSPLQPTCHALVIEYVHFFDSYKFKKSRTNFKSQS